MAKTVDTFGRIDILVNNASMQVLFSAESPALNIFVPCWAHHAGSSEEAFQYLTFLMRHNIAAL